MERLVIPTWLVDQMLASAQTLPTEEICGLLGGLGCIVQNGVFVKNEHASASRFRMSPEDQFAAFQTLSHQGLDVVGVFHSHPNGPSHPSPTDLVEHYDPDVACVIIFPSGDNWDMAGFIIENGRWEELQLEKGVVIDGFGGDNNGV